MRLAENESQRVGMKFEALVELSQERSDVGFEKIACFVTSLIYQKKILPIENRESFT
jgi:hypothetical protein